MWQVYSYKTSSNSAFALSVFIAWECLVKNRHVLCLHSHCLLFLNARMQTVCNSTVLSVYLWTSTKALVEASLWQGFQKCPQPNYYKHLTLNKYIQNYPLLMLRFSFYPFRLWQLCNSCNSGKILSQILYTTQMLKIIKRNFKYGIVPWEPDMWHRKLFHDTTAIPSARVKPVALGADEMIECWSACVYISSTVAVDMTAL